MVKQTIKTNILSVFLILIGVVATALLTSQYYFSTKLAITSTDKTFKLITGNIAQQRNKYNHRVQRILQANINNENLFKDISFNYEHPALQDLIQMMNINHSIYAMYFAHKNGSFYEVVNMEESSILYDIYKAPKETRWTIMIHIDNTMQYVFLDDNNKFISKYSTIKKYNPLTRLWYVDAINSNTPIRTEPYLFSHLKKSGMTYATHLKQKGSVFAMDYTMSKLDKILSLQKVEKTLKYLYLINMVINLRHQILRQMALKKFIKNPKKK